MYEHRTLSGGCFPRVATAGDIIFLDIRELFAKESNVKVTIGVILQSRRNLIERTT